MATDARESQRIRNRLTRRRTTIDCLERAFRKLATAGVLFTAVSGCHSTPRLTRQEEAGKHLYSLRCAHCHQDNDLALKKVPPDLYHIFDRSILPSGVPATDANVRTAVQAGKGMMPSFAGRFTDEQMADLIAYLHTGLR
jgi:mono/diheme cytochrome c family protein